MTLKIVTDTLLAKRWVAASWAPIPLRLIVGVGYMLRSASNFIDAADIPLAAEHGVVRAFLVDPRAKAGRAHG
jgi:hypothetical protein